MLPASQLRDRQADAGCQEQVLTPLLRGELVRHARGAPLLVKAAEHTSHVDGSHSSRLEIQTSGSRTPSTAHCNCEALAAHPGLLQQDACTAGRC